MNVTINGQLNILPGLRPRPDVFACPIANVVHSDRLRPGLAAQPPVEYPLEAIDTGVVRQSVAIGKRHLFVVRRFILATQITQRMKRHVAVGIRPHRVDRQINSRHSVNEFHKLGHLIWRKILHHRQRHIEFLMVVPVKPLRGEHERLAETHADLHRQIAHHLVPRFATKFSLRRAPKFSALLQSEIMLTKKWTQLIDVDVHIEPQPVDGERLLVAVKNPAARGWQANRPDRLVLLLASIVCSCRQLQIPQLADQQQHAAQDKDHHQPDREILAAELIKNEHA